MVIPAWTAVAKWLGLAVVAVGLIAVPVVYHNNKVSEAFEQGKQVAVAECKEQMAQALHEQAERASKTIQIETAISNALEEKNEKLAKKAAIAEKKLLEALSKPLPDVFEQFKNEALPAPATGCVINSNATSLLRSFADGDFSLEGDAVPGQLDPKVPNRTELPREGGINNTGFSSGIPSSSESVLRMR